MCIRDSDLPDHQAERERAEERRHNSQDMLGQVAKLVDRALAGANLAQDRCV